jgi:ketosteroid isomerase-like protein
MIRSIRTSLAAGLLLALAAPTLAAPSGVEDVDLAWKKAIVANDVEAVMACYAPDAVAWLPDMPEARGVTAIREGYKQLLGANTIKEATFSDTHYEIHGDRATGWGHFSLTLVPKSGDGAGKPVTMKGRFSEVAIKREGRWVYALDHASAEPAPAIATPPK